MVISSILASCGPSKDETRKYLSSVSSILKDSQKRANEAWTSVGAFSELHDGYEKAIRHQPSDGVDPIVVAKVHHVAKCGIVLLDEKDGELAAAFKGGLIGAALALDFGGVTWGSSSAGAFSILSDDQSKENHAAERFDDAFNDLHQYVLEKGY